MIGKGEPLQRIETRTATPADELTEPIALSAPAVGPAPAILALADWAYARLDFVPAERLHIDDAFTDYCDVAKAAGKRVLRATEFRRALLQALLELECDVWGEMVDGVRLSATHDTQATRDGGEVDSGALA